MFHSSTTLWQKNDLSSPLNPMGNRPVFAVPGKVGTKIRNFFGGASNFKNEVFDAADALTEPVISRIKWMRWLFPSQYIWTGIKTGYNYFAKPIYKIGSVAAGTAWEAGCGLKDAIYYPAKTLIKAPLTNLKMSLWDFPVYLTKSAAKLPFELLKTPGRFLGEAKKLFAEFPGKVMNVLKTTRDNVGKVLESMTTPSSFAIPSPIEVAKSIGKATRDLVKGTLVEPVKDTFNLLWKPIAPVCALPAGAAGIVWNSKWQYATSMGKAAGEARDGLKRVMNAPGKELDTHGIKKWWNEVYPPKPKELAKPTVDAKTGEKPAKPDKPAKPPKPDKKEGE